MQLISKSVSCVVLALFKATSEPSILQGTVNNFLKLNELPEIKMGDLDFSGCFSSMMTGDGVPANVEQGVGTRKSALAGGGERGNLSSKGSELTFYKRWGTDTSSFASFSRAVKNKSIY